MVVQLVKAVTADAEDMQRMQVECFTPHLERYQDYTTSPANEPIEKMISRINYERGCYFKVMVDEIHVGCIWVFEKAPRHYRIGIIYISPRFQGKRIGQRALRQVEELLYPDVESWELDCPTDMTINRRCYEQAGYRLVGEPKIINDKLTLVSYRKDVQ